MWMPWAVVSYRMSPVRVFWCLSLICTEGCALLICHIRVPVSPWLLVANIDPHLLAGALIRLLHGEAPSPSTVLSGGVSLHTHILPGPVFLLWPPALPICLQKAGPPLRVSGASITDQPQAVPITDLLRCGPRGISAKISGHLHLHPDPFLPSLLGSLALSLIGTR